MDDGVVLVISFSIHGLQQIEEVLLQCSEFFLNDNSVLDFVKYFSVSIQVVMFFFSPSF